MSLPTIFYTLPADAVRAGMSTEDGCDVLTAKTRTDHNGTQFVLLDVYVPRPDEPEIDAANREFTEGRVYQRDQRVELAVFADTTVDGSTDPRAVIPRGDAEPAVPKVEVVIHRDPDDATTVTVYLNGQPVDAAEFHVDPGRAGNEPEEVAAQRASRADNLAQASPRAAAQLAELYGHYPLPGPRTFDPQHAPDPERNPLGATLWALEAAAAAVQRRDREYWLAITAWAREHDVLNAEQIADTYRHTVRKMAVPPDFWEDGQLR